MVYTINGDMQVRNYVNHINGIAHTYAGENGTSFRGLLGPSFQEKTSDLFMKTGTYSLWTSEK